MDELIAALAAADPDETVPVVTLEAFAAAVVVARWRPQPHVPHNTEAPDDPAQIIDRIRPVLIAHGWTAPE